MLEVGHKLEEETNNVQEFEIEKDKLQQCLHVVDSIITMKWIVEVNIGSTYPKKDLAWVIWRLSSPPWLICTLLFRYDISHVAHGMFDNLVFILNDRMDEMEDLSVEDM